MILESELAAVVAKQREIELKKPVGQARPLDFNDILLESHALDITGVRRCGKSTVMRQRIRGSREPWFYVNFESPLLTQFEMRDTARLDALIEKAGRGGSFSTRWISLRDGRSTFARSWTRGSVSAFPGLMRRCWRGSWGAS